MYLLREKKETTFSLGVATYLQLGHLEESLNPDLRMRIILVRILRGLINADSFFFRWHYCRH